MHHLFICSTYTDWMGGTPQPNPQPPAIHRNRRIDARTYVQSDGRVVGGGRAAGGAGGGRHRQAPRRGPGQSVSLSSLGRWLTGWIGWVCIGERALTHARLPGPTDPTNPQPQHLYASRTLRACPLPWSPMWSARCAGRPTPPSSGGRTGRPSVRFLLGCVICDLCCGRSMD